VLRHITVGWGLLKLKLGGFKMKSSGLFKMFKEYDNEENFQNKIRLKEDIASQWREQHNAPDVETNEIIRQLYEEYDKGITKHRLSKLK
jgi:hypothetical protein